jgi:hypothetical protein
MVEWWQALVLVLAGGLAGLPTAYFVHRWTTRASREAEERQAIRHLRRERMQPVLDFLNIAKRFAARQTIEEALDEVYEKMSGDVRPARDRWQEMKEDVFEAYPDVVGVTRAVSVALWSGVSVPGLLHKLVRMYSAVHPASHRKRQPELADAIRSVEELVEQYLAGAEPHESTADEPSEEA